MTKRGRVIRWMTRHIDRFFRARYKKGGEFSAGVLKEHLDQTYADKRETAVLVISRMTNFDAKNWHRCANGAGYSSLSRRLCKAIQRHNNDLTVVKLLSPAESYHDRTANRNLPGLFQ